MMFWQRNPPDRTDPQGGETVLLVQESRHPIGRLGLFLRADDEAEIVAANGVNVEDWRHDLSNRDRALTIGIVTVPDACDVRRLQRELSDKLAPFGMAVSLRHENIFRATNEVGPIDALMKAVPRE